MEVFKRTSSWALCWVGLGLAVCSRKSQNSTSGLNELDMYFVSS